MGACRNSLFPQRNGKSHSLWQQRPGQAEKGKLQQQPQSERIFLPCPNLPRYLGCYRNIIFCIPGLWLSYHGAENDSGDGDGDKSGGAEGSAGIFLVYKQHHARAKGSDMHCGSCTAFGTEFLL